MKESFYFPHDVNAIQDPKMVTMLMECGATGIGLFWIIIELMHQQCNGITVAQLTHYINLYGKQGTYDQLTLDKVGKVLFDTKLLIEKDGMVYSERVINNMKKRHELSEIGKENAIKRWHGNAVAMQGQCHPNAIKERKGNEKKEEVCSEPKETSVAEPTSPPILVFKTKGKEKEWPLTEDFVTTLKASFPGFNIEGACRHAWGWCEANPEKRKTSRGMRKFLYRWIGRDNDKGGFEVEKKEAIVL